MRKRTKSKSKKRKRPNRLLGNESQGSSPKSAMMGIEGVSFPFSEVGGTIFITISKGQNQAGQRATASRDTLTPTTRTHVCDPKTLHQRREAHLGNLHDSSSW